MVQQHMFDYKKAIEQRSSQDLGRDASIVINLTLTCLCCDCYHCCLACGAEEDADD